MPDSVELRKRIKHLLGEIELSSGQKQIPNGRRSSWRYAWLIPATVEFVDPDNSSEPVYITTRSISAKGLDFCSPRMFQRGCKIVITVKTDKGELQIPATVKHSTESVGMPIVGVNFDLG